MIENWDDLDDKEKIAAMEEAIAREIGPHMARDGGGLEIVDFIDDKKVIISYQGACRGCPHAVDGTLSAIQRLLQKEIHPDLEVIPDFMHNKK